MKYKQFIFESYHFNTKTKELLLNYSFDEKLSFCEKITFPTDKQLSNDELVALDCAFKYLHIAAGISYYKLFLAEEIIIKTLTLNKQQAAFFNMFYTKGLGEFCYKNKIYDITKIVNFPYKEREANKSVNIPLNHRPCVPLGGGKDSIVVLEIAKLLGPKPITGSINGINSPIEGTAKIAGLENFVIKREIAANLLEINADLAKYQAYNGHVPITGIIAFILCAASILYDFDTVYISNERSANYGNLMFDNTIINHQWSKSLEFEQSVNIFFTKYVLKNFHYISILRPLSEYHIAMIFSKLDRKYHQIFTSCNKVYKIQEAHKTWCCNCDKCRFVFLILSNFINQKDLVKIFGKNLFQDKTQLDGFKALAGLEAFKPFECVGEISESVCAFLGTHESFHKDYIVKTITPLLHDQYDFTKLREQLLTPSTENLRHLALYKEILDIIKYKLS